MQVCFFAHNQEQLRRVSADQLVKQEEDDAFAVVMSIPANASADSHQVYLSGFLCAL